MVYEWRTYNRPVSAQDAGEYIEELDKQYGEVTPQILLDDARPETALLHPLYEWNDGIAAEKYRLSQSRKILSDLVAVQVEQIKNDRLKEPVRAFVSVNKEKEKASFRPITVAMSNEQTRERVVENALSELNACKRKYDGLIDFCEIVRQWLEEQ